jgi:hypothetical protein
MLMINVNVDMMLGGFDISTLFDNMCRHTLKMHKPVKAGVHYELLVNKVYLSN